MKTIRQLALLCVATTLSGCAVPFYWQAINGQLELLRKRTPIEKLVDDPAVDSGLRTKLSSVATMRRFAVDELGLPDNKSYTSYVALDRSYVVWNVVAAKEFSVDPERWCFPFAGCVAYRGFFARDKAERFQAELMAEGLDTYSGGSSAYSTLGYFADPVLSTMIVGGDQYVASTLFHELAHQKLYIKGDSEFSEAYATTIEEYGTERWLMTHGAPADVDRYRQRRQRGADFGQLITGQQSRLRNVYAGPDPPEAKRVAKRLAFEKLQSDYAAVKSKWGGNAEYDAWFAQPLNNAALAAVATYTRWVPVLRARLESRGLDGFYADTTALAKLTNDERAERLRGWAIAPVSASE
ncbi:MAG: aminopeptidase [Gammaproteobacteria bacterium]